MASPSPRLLLSSPHLQYVEQSLRPRPRSPQPNTENAGPALSIALLLEVESAALPAGPEEGCGMAKSQDHVVFQSCCGAGAGESAEKPLAVSCWDPMA